MLFDWDQDALTRAVKAANVEAILSAHEGLSVDTLYSLASGEKTTLLHLAVSIGNTFRVEALIEARASLELKNRKGQTPLVLAFEKHNSPSIVALLKAGARLDVLKHNRSLHMAATADDVLLVNCLLKAQAPIGASVLGSSLCVAVTYGRAATTSALLDASAAVDTPSLDGSTPLVAAAAEGYIDVMERLLAARASVDLANSAGRTRCDSRLEPFTG